MPNRVDTSGITQIQSTLAELVEFTSKGVKVGWPDEADGVTDWIQQKMFWLERGTEKQPPRPFIRLTEREASLRAGDRIEDDIMSILNGEANADAVWNQIGKFWAERMDQNRLDMTTIIPLSDSTKEWERRNNSSTPEQVGRFLGDSTDVGPTYIIERL